MKDAVREFANIVASHAVGMTAAQLSDSMTVQIVVGLPSAPQNLGRSQLLSVS